MQRKELVKLVEVLPGIKTKIFEWEGQRVLTFAQIDKLHQRPEGTANATFRRNKKRFVEGVDYFLLDNQSGDVLRCDSEVTHQGFPVLILITESGYLMIVKSFKDDLSWNIQRGLVNCYFRFKESENITLSRKKIKELKRQIFSLENEPLTLLGFQQLSLKERKAQRSQIWEIWKNMGATKPALNYRRIQVAKRVNLIVNGMTSYAFKRRTQAAGLARDWMPLENQYCFYLAEFDLLNQLRQRNFAVSFEFIESLYPRLAYAAKARVEALCEVSLSINIEEEVDNVLRLVREQVEFQNTPYTQIEEQLLFCSNILVDESKRLIS
jgi:hypothetical protein